MAAASQYYSVTARVGVPHRHEVEVTVPLVGPVGPQGPAGAAGASTWNDISGKPSTFTPSAHASTHHTNGADAIAPNNISAAWAEVSSNQAITADTLLSAGRNRRIGLGAAGVTANVDLPNQNNQAGDVVTLVADVIIASTLSIRRATVMSGSTPVAYSTLATLNATGQIFTFVSDGTATGWSLRAVDSHDASRVTSGTFDSARINFAAPPAIGSTTPNAGTFTTLNATGTTELVNGGTTAGPFRLYNISSAANANYERGFMRWSSNVLQIGTEKAGTGSARALEFQVDGTTRWSVTTGGDFSSTTNGVIARSCNIGRFAAGNIDIASDTSNISFGVLSDIFLSREAAGILGQNGGGIANSAQEYRLYATRITSTNFQRMNIKSVKQTLSALSGASATTTGTFIPDGAVVVGVTTRVTTLLAGATGYTIGDGTDADRWGDITGTAVGTTSDNRDWTAGTIECFTTGGNITLTAKTANFTAGAIEVCVFFLAGEAD